jgi:hypothetical protein
MVMARKRKSDNVFILFLQFINIEILHIFEGSWSRWRLKIVRKKNEEMMCIFLILEYSAKVDESIWLLMRTMQLD